MLVRTLAVVYSTATVVPVNVPVLTAFAGFFPTGTPHVGPPVKLIELFPESVSGENEPAVSAPESATAGVSVKSISSVPVAVEGFAFGVHFRLAAPEAGSPAPVNTEQSTAPAVFSVALYVAPVKLSPVHPVSAPLIFNVSGAAVFVKPGDSVIVPVLDAHSACTTV